MEQTHKQEEKRKSLLRERRKVETELVAQGKNPFYLKKSIHRDFILYANHFCS